jgi:hypothetical protein
MRSPRTRREGAKARTLSEQHLRKGVFTETQRESGEAIVTKVKGSRFPRTRTEDQSVQYHRGAKKTKWLQL